MWVRFSLPIFKNNRKREHLPRCQLFMFFSPPKAQRTPTNNEPYQLPPALFNAAFGGGRFGALLRISGAGRVDTMPRKIWMLVTNLGDGFKYDLFSSLFGEDEPILTNIFQRGWNHVETTNQKILMLVTFFGGWMAPNAVFWHFVGWMGCKLLLFLPEIILLCKMGGTPLHYFGQLSTSMIMGERVLWLCFSQSIDASNNESINPSTYLRSMVGTSNFFGDGNPYEIWTGTKSLNLFFQGAFSRICPSIILSSN